MATGIAKQQFADVSPIKNDDCAIVMLVFWRAISISPWDRGASQLNVYHNYIPKNVYPETVLYPMFEPHISIYQPKWGPISWHIFFPSNPPQKRRSHRWDPGMYICPTSKSGPFRQPNKDPSIPRTQRSTSDF